MGVTGDNSIRKGVKHPPWSGEGQVTGMYPTLLYTQEQKARS